MVNNIFDTAFIIEGGGMKAGFSSGVINILLENKIYFDFVTGVSAGAGNLIAYLSRDKKRLRNSFTSFAQRDEFASWDSFFLGRGYFNSDYIYSNKGLKDLPFDFKTFFENPAKYIIPAFNSKSGESVYFTNENIKKKIDLLQAVRASSTFPLLSPKTYINNVEFFDGGLCEDAGFLLSKIENMGYKKIFMISTHEKGHRKEEQKFKNLLRILYCDKPKVYEAIVNRYKTYNNIMDKIDQMESEKKALVIRPKRELCSLTESNPCQLKNTYFRGKIAADKNIEKIKEFLY